MRVVAMPFDFTASRSAIQMHTPTFNSQDHIDGESRGIAHGG